MAVAVVPGLLVAVVAMKVSIKKYLLDEQVALQTVSLLANDRHDDLPPSRLDIALQMEELLPGAEH